ncbi:MAG: ABC transporter permease [Defluviitaleaceae bacterium]|jgi:peptide/nickel transport system permease protein|nr:ABC transporter permease [Defluviitaleaceae bacterium]
MNTNTSSAWKIMWREIYHDKFALIGLILFVAIVATVYIWALFIDPVEAGVVNLRTMRQSPAESEFLLGTDSAGRPMLQQLILSARNSFSIAFLVTIGGALMGITFGLFAGFYGGHVDNVLMRLMNFYTMIPTMMIIIVFIVLIPNYSVITFSMLMIGLFSWLSSASLIRIKALQQGRMDYVSASKTLGTPNIVIIFREVLPNLVSIIVSSITLSLAANMGIETGLTFLGFGLPFGTPSLGRLVFYARTPANLTGRLWLWLPAALLIIVMMLSINFVGQALNRAADAKKRSI